MTPIQELAEKLHIGLAEELLSRLNSGEATTQDLNVIRQFLKDNNISGVPVEDEQTGKANPLKQLVDSLPFKQSLFLPQGVKDQLNSSN